MSEDITMSEWLKLERLPHNDLPLPEFATKQSAGIDLAACLTRPCMLVTTLAELAEAGKSTKSNFLCDCNGRRIINIQSAPDSGAKLVIGPDETILIPIGFKSEFGDRYVLGLYARSSIAIAGLMLANSVAVVDSDYRGEIFVPFWNRTTHSITVSHGQRIAQGVLTQFSRPIIKECQVGDTKRGEGGFGSTGTKSKPAKVTQASA